MWGGLQELRDTYTHMCKQMQRTHVDLVQRPNIPTYKFCFSFLYVTEHVCVAHRRSFPRRGTGDWWGKVFRMRNKEACDSFFTFSFCSKGSLCLLCKTSPWVCTHTRRPASHWPIRELPRSIGPQCFVRHRVIRFTQCAAAYVAPGQKVKGET